MIFASLLVRTVIPIMIVIAGLDPVIHLRKKTCDED